MAAEEIGTGEIAPRQRKVVDAVLRHASLHGIRVGGRLPSIRDIASNTGIAHATVAKAIKYLSDAGIVEARGRNGTVLVRDLGRGSGRVLQRLVFLNHVPDSNAATLSTSLIDFELRSGIKSLSPGTDVVSALHVPQDGDGFIEDLIDYHFTHRGRPKNVMFALGGCPPSVKRIFQRREVPAVIIGGREEGITIPNITIDVKAVVDQVMQVVTDADAYPAMFLVDIDWLVGEQAELFRLFNELAASDSDNVRVVRTSGAPEVFYGQLTQVLRSQSRPGTIIARGDESATRVMRVCAELGLQQIRVISLESTALGQRFIPSLTGAHRDYFAVARTLLDFARDISEGKDVAGVRKVIETIMVFRESFPNPYTVAPAFG